MQDIQKLTLKGSFEGKGKIYFSINLIKREIRIEKKSGELCCKVFELFLLAIGELNSGPFINFINFGVNLNNNRTAFQTKSMNHSDKKVQFCMHGFINIITKKKTI